MAAAIVIALSGYPAIAAAATSPLLGDPSVESMVDNNAAGSAEAFPFVATSSGTSASISVYIDSSNEARGASVGVYADAGRSPGVLLSSGATRGLASGTWNTLPVGSASISAGTAYWVAVLGTGGQIAFRDRMGASCYSQTSGQGWLRGLPSKWSTGENWPTCPMSSAVTGSRTTPPAVSPPSNTALPVVSGTVTLGHTLATTNGSWTGNPTSYAYQWQDCNTSGTSCTNVAGVSSASYTLTSSDVGHTMRAVVTATNGSGSTAASSAQTGTVSSAIPTPAPPPSPRPPSSPPPSNTALPVLSGSVVQGQTLSTSNGSWTGSPTSYGYRWQDCNTSGSGCTNVSGATSSSYKLGSGDVAHTIRAVVTATDIGGSASASSAQTVVVTAAPPPPPSSPPSNTALPMVSGSTVQGQVLSTSNGSWTGSPTSYAYQWQDCNTSGTGCTNVSGATSSSYTLGAGDVGHTIRAVVTATNAAGSWSATSAQTAVVSAPTGKTLNCFSAPGACGYPDPNFGNVGVPASTTLTNSGTINVTKDGTTINAANVTGEIDINAPAGSTITIQNSKVTMTGGGCGTTNTCGNADIHSFCNCTLNISHVELTTDPGTTVEHAIRNSYGGTLNADHVYQHGNTDALCWCGHANLLDNYSLIHLAIANDHLENTYSDGDTLTIQHNTLLNREGQTANIFANTNNGAGGACTNKLTIKNNLLAGGGYTLYPCGNASSPGSSFMDVENNHFARCGGSNEISGGGGSWVCPGGPDQNGYYPGAGAFGQDSYIYCPPTNGNIWAGNIWDDDGNTMGC